MKVLLKNGEYSYEPELGLLGKGSFGSVYKGVIVKSNEVVAIKAMSLALIKQYGPDIKQIIKNEVAVLKDLSNKMYVTPCPFIIRIYDCFLTENNIYLILEFCGEGDLSGILNKRKRIPEAEALEIIYHIVRALDFLNKNGVCHRDLKPENIFVTRHQNSGVLMFKVGDFGFAVNSVKNSQQVGTYPYMSPELLRGEDYGSEVDVWALGVIAHQILFGESYFIGRNEAEVKNNVLNKEYIIKEEKSISKELADFLYSCLRKDKRKRIRTEELRAHPVFRALEEKYNQLVSPQLKHKDSKEQILTSTRLENELNKAVFLQELGRNLLVKDRYNLLSISLIKSCLYRLNRLRNQLNERINLFGASPEVWQNITNSAWYSNFTKYCQYMLTCCETFYKSELAVFNNSLKQFSQEQAQLLLYNLGDGSDIPPNDKCLALDLVKYAKMLQDQPDRDSKILSHELILAIKLDQLNYDFGKHLKERAGLDPAVFHQTVRSLEQK